MFNIDAARPARYLAALLGSVVVMTSCIPSGPPRADSSPTVETQQRPISETKTPGSTAPRPLVVGMTAPRRESNEPRHISQPDSFQIRPMYEYLIGLDASTGKLIPQLATEWSLEPDGQSYRFKLRKGVQFHHGYGEFNAKDVVYSWMDFVQEDSFHGQARNFREMVENVEIVNDYEVIFRLRRPDAQFLIVISESESGMEMRSKAHFDASGVPTMESAPLAGTGPFQFKGRVQGAHIRYDRVPYQHWRAAPSFSALELRFQKEPSTRLASILAGETHVTSLPQDLFSDAQNRGFTVIRGQVPGSRTFASFICCYLKDPKDPSQGYVHPDTPLLDVRVRKALSKAINRDELNRAFFAGKAELMMNNHFHPSFSGWNRDWETRFSEEYGYDPTKAKALLAEAGRASMSVSVLLNPTWYSGVDDVAEAIAGYWRAIGLGVELVQIDPSQITAVRRQLNFANHFEIMGFGGSRFLATRVFNSSLDSRGPGMEHPEADAIMSQLARTLDDSKQEQLWRQLGDVMFEQHMSIPLFWLPAEVVVNPNVVGGYVFPGSTTTNWTHFENIQAVQ